MWLRDLGADGRRASQPTISNRLGSRANGRLQDRARVHQRIEQGLLLRILRGRLLRMPLDESIHQPGRSRASTRPSSVRPAGTSPSPSAVDPLVMVRQALHRPRPLTRARRLEGSTDDLVQHRLVGRRDAVAPHAADLGQVLVQRSAERDVQHLEAAADRERRRDAGLAAARTTSTSKPSRTGSTP